MNINVNSENFLGYDEDHFQPDKTIGTSISPNFTHQMIGNSNERQQELHMNEGFSVTKSVILDDLKKSFKNDKRVLDNRNNKLQFDYIKEIISFPIFIPTDQNSTSKTNSISIELPSDPDESLNFFNSASQVNQTNKEVPVLNVDHKETICEDTLPNLEIISCKRTQYESKDMVSCKSLSSMNSKKQLPEMLDLCVNEHRIIMNSLTEHENKDIFQEQKISGNEFVKEFESLSQPFIITHKAFLSSDRPDCQLPILENEKLISQYENPVLKINYSRYSTSHLKFTNVSSQLVKENSAMNSYHVKTCQKNSENKNVNQTSDQLLQSTTENENLEKLFCSERDLPLMYTKRLIQKCWRTWRAYVQCASSQKAYSEERNVRHAKIHTFIEILRQHKESSNIEDLPYQIENEKEKYLSLHLRKSNQLGKYSAHKNSRTTKRGEKNFQVDKFEMIKKSQVYQTSSNKCYTTSSRLENLHSDLKNIHKCPALKHFTPICYRFEAQKHIIAKQKRQLEHQKKVIDGLKLENLNKEAKISATHALDHMAYCASHHKGEVSDLNDSKKKHVTKMSNKDLPKRGKWLQIMREREKKMQKERIIKKEAKLLSQKTAEEEERRKIEEEIQEKRRLRLVTEKRRLLANQKLDEITNIAIQYYKRKLLEKYGITAMKNFVAVEKEKVVVLKEYINQRVIVKHFYEWKHYVQNLNQQRNILAMSCYNTHLMRRGFTAFFKVHEFKIENEQVAEDFDDLRIVVHALNKLQLHAYQQKIIENALQCQAEQFYQRKILENAWKAWKLFPGIMEKEKEKEKRIEFWRLKVREILPDFNPILEEYY